MIFLNGKQIGKLDIKPKVEQIDDNNNIDLDIYNSKKIFLGEQQVYGNKERHYIIKNNQIVGDTSVVKQYYGRQYNNMAVNNIQQTNLLNTYDPTFTTQSNGIKITLQNYTGAQYSWDYSVLYIVVDNQVKKVGGDADTYLAYLQCLSYSDAKGAFFGKGPIQYYQSSNPQRSYPNLSICNGVYNFLGGAMGSGSNFSLGTGYLKDISAVVHNLYYYD